ncbi:hypothetical protein LguiA_004162 [Lonicera macranthoides]
MDNSGNSGSIQSSSGGDEEHNSNFLNPSQAHFGTFLDPSSSQNLEPFSHSNPNNTPYNLDSLWSNTLVRSNPQFTPFEKSQFPTPPSIDHQSATTNDQKKVTKNPKKRARASRKAPTTVFTTDTTNFRQMVQEYTGIRADPFTPASFSCRPYPPSSSSSATFFSNNSSTIVDALGTTTTNKNYQPPFSGNSMENQILSFQTLLQTQGASRSSDSIGVNQNLGGFQSQHFGPTNGRSRFQP